MNQDTKTCKHIPIPCNMDSCDGVEFVHYFHCEDCGIALKPKQDQVKTMCAKCQFEEGHSLQCPHYKSESWQEDAYGYLRDKPKESWVERFDKIVEHNRDFGCAAHSEGLSCCLDLGEERNELVKSFISQLLAETKQECKEKLQHLENFYKKFVEQQKYIQKQELIKKIEGMFIDFSKKKKEERLKMSDDDIGFMNGWNDALKDIVTNLDS